MASARTFDYYRGRPAARPRPQVVSAPSRELVLYGDLPGVLRNVAVLMGWLTGVGVGLLLFRLYYQLTGGVPEAGPASWLYSLSSIFVAPFRSFETARLADGSRALEFAVLVGIEGLLAFGLLVVISAYQGSKHAATYAPNPWVGRYEVGPAVARWERLDRQAESLTRAAIREVKQGMTRIDAALTKAPRDHESTQAARSRLERELRAAQPRQSMR